jgi:hypothetical protein
MHLLDEEHVAYLCFMRLLTLVLLFMSALFAKGALKEDLLRIKKYDLHEFLVKFKADAGNPFKDTGLTGKFIAPSGKVVLINGFYDGDGQWKLRFSPDETGTWSYELSGIHFNYTQSGKLSCIKSPSAGFIGINKENPYAFAYRSGLPFFPMGDTSYGLYDDSPVTAELRDTYLDTRRREAFNFIRMEVCHSHSRGAKDNAYWPWGGTVDKPDLDRFNPVFFEGLDKLLLMMKNKGMNAELILLNFYRLPFTNTKQWTPDRERRWLKYLLARYAAFSNIFMWTISNEYETHPDGAYRLDNPEDVDWAIRTAKFIAEDDPYHHLVTVHPVIPSSTTGSSPASAINYPWRIGGFFGKEHAIAVLSQQTGQSQYWEGDDINLTKSIRADRIYGKPVINTENGYEYLSTQATMKKQVHGTDKVRHSAWRIVCSGGYFAAGFNGTLAHSDIWNQIDRPNQYSFVLKDEGAAAQFGLLYRFFTALSFWRMNPYDGVSDNAVALSDGKTYVVYLPAGGTASLEVIYKRKPKGSWFNPRTGIYLKALVSAEKGKLNFRAPDHNDWVLLIK